MATTESTPLLSQPEGAVRVSHYQTTSRFIAFQAVSLVSAIDGLAGTWTLKQLAAKQVIAASRGATIDYTEGWWAGFLLTAGGGISGLICGIVFIVMMLHPSHYETKATVAAKESLFAICSVLLLAACIFSTIVFATQSAVLYTPDLSHKARHALQAELGSLAYKESTSALVFIIGGWLTWLALIFSLILVSVTGRHVLRNGPALNAPKGLPERLADRYLSQLLGYRADEQRQ